MPQTGEGLAERAVAAVLKVLEPEEVDAEALYAKLPEDIRKGLIRATKKLPGEAGAAAARGDKLNLQVRHQLIIRLRAQGMMEDRVARAVGVTTMTVRTVVKNYWKDKRVSLDSEDMDEFILLLAEGYLEDIDRLTDLVRSATHSSAIVGAIKARQEARQQYVDLLADFGFLKRKPQEVDVTVEGADSTTNVLVIDPAMMKMYTKDLLAQKRMSQGQSQDLEADDALADLVVQSDDVSPAATR